MGSSVLTSAQKIFQAFSIFKMKLFLVVGIILAVVLGIVEGGRLQRSLQRVVRSAQEPAAEGEEKPPVWCSFSLPWRGVSGIDVKRLLELEQQPENELKTTINFIDFQ